MLAKSLFSQLVLKGTVLSKMKILSTFIHSHFVPNLGETGDFKFRTVSKSSIKVIIKVVHMTYVLLKATQSELFTTATKSLNQ